MKNDTATAIVFALQGSYEYHNALMTSYQPGGISIESKIPLSVGTDIVVKPVDFCAILEGRVVACAPAGAGYHIDLTFTS